jgi:hypothetical protein
MELSVKVDEVKPVAGNAAPSGTQNKEESFFPIGASDLNKFLTLTSLSGGLTLAIYSGIEASPAGSLAAIVFTSAGMLNLNISGTGKFLWIMFAAAMAGRQLYPLAHGY